MTIIIDKDRAGLIHANDDAMPAQENGHRLTAIPSFLRRGVDWFKHMWGTIKL